MSGSQQGSLFNFDNERESFRKEMEIQRKVYEKRMERIREAREKSVDSYYNPASVYNCAQQSSMIRPTIQQSCASYNSNTNDSLIEEINRLRVENANLRNEKNSLYAEIKRLRTHYESLILNYTQAHQSGFISVPKKEESYVIRDMFVANWKQRIADAKEFAKNLADKTIKWFNT